jgi:phosphatidylserine/phosphatidylglycerophosphate/cardiolipin synthase-like enzyme/uncharacterized membrane protein YdjX (TVP38/TMEM64 family)
MPDVRTSCDASALLREGDTCWRVAPASRVAFLVDGEAFFAAVDAAIRNARLGIWLVGWDFHSAVRLRRSGPADGCDDLVSLLEAQVRRHPSLHVHVLAWDFAMLYALEREFLPLLQFGVKTHRRIHFAMDAAHPLTASQHQKLVIVDDAVAFLGGFDLTSHRWDTREHRPHDPRRVTPAGKPYPPFHDVQIVVDAEAAAALGTLARQRWRRATGKQVPPTRTARDPWPASLEPWIRDVRIGIVRTLPSCDGNPEIREVEALYRASIAAARSSIYVENQYLTSSRIGRWLAARLAEPEGPEVVVVGPRENAGWLEESTMGALRDQIVRELREADRHDRLRVLYPHIDRLPEDQIVNVHSKVMIVDDDFVRVGSSNLSNRSLGLDTECDAALESGGEDRVRRAIARLRSDLLAEHLGTTIARVEEGIERAGSLAQAIDGLCGGERTLRPLTLEASSWTAEAVDALGAVDPEHPVPLEELVTRFEEDGGAPAPSRGRSLQGFVALLLFMAACTLLLETTPLGDWITTERLTLALAFFRGAWYGPVLGAAIFTLASLVLLPVMPLTLASGLAFGPVLGFAVAWSGAIVSAALGHLVGQKLWRESVRRLAGDRLNALSRRLARRGIVSSALVRIVPVAPFTVVNLVAGASHVRARDFVVGTALGILPGTIVLVVAGDWARSLFAEPRPSPWPWVALAVLALLGGALAAKRLPRRRKPVTGEPR